MKSVPTSVRFPSKKIYNAFRRVAKKEGISLRMLLERAMLAVVTAASEKEKSEKCQQNIILKRN